MYAATRRYNAYDEHDAYDEPYVNEHWRIAFT